MLAKCRTVALNLIILDEKVYYFKISISLITSELIFLYMKIGKVCVLICIGVAGTLERAPK